MAQTITPTVESKSFREKIIKWAGVDVGDTCLPALVHPFDDITLKCVAQDDGTTTASWGSSPLSVKFAGSSEKDGSTGADEATVNEQYVLLDDIAGTEIEMTANGWAVCGPSPRWVKPIISAGDTSTTSVDIYMELK